MNSIQQLFFYSILLLSLFSSCQENPCDTVSCFNGGICNEGICDCPKGYTGEDCATEMLPSSMTISQIIVYSYPPNNNTISWDATSRPDLYVAIAADSTITSADRVSTIANNHTTGEISYVFATPYTLSNINGLAQIALFDADSSSTDDLMAMIPFRPNSYTAGFPESIKMRFGCFICTVYVTWDF